MRKTFLLMILAAVASIEGGTLDRPYSQTVRAVDLYAAFAKNEVDADAKFKSRRFSVGGAIYKVGKEPDGDPYVLLVGGNYVYVRCKFSEAFNAKIAKLQPGSLIAFNGTIAGFVNGEVVVKDCSY